MILPCFKFIDATMSEQKNRAGNKISNAIGKKWNKSGFSNLNEQIPTVKTMYNTKNYRFKKPEMNTQCQCTWFAHRKLNELKLLIKIRNLNSVLTLFCALWFEITIIPTKQHNTSKYNIQNFSCATTRLENKTRFFAWKHANDIMRLLNI